MTVLSASMPLNIRGPVDGFKDQPYGLRTKSANPHFQVSAFMVAGI